MVQLAVALIAASAAVLTAWGWPTLPRRIKDHVALLKDLPEGSDAGLKTLVEEEIRELVRRDRRKLEPRTELFFGIRRAATAVIATTLLVIILTSFESPKGQVPDEFAQGMGNTTPLGSWGLLFILAIAGVVVGLAIIALRSVSDLRRLRRRAR